MNRWMRYVRAMLVAALLLVGPGLAVVHAAGPADDLSSVRATPCATHEWRASDDLGKTEIGFEARATDGCHVYIWDNTTTDSPGAGTLTFKTSHVFNGWQAGNTLPKMEAGYCQYRAAHEANLLFVNYFDVPDGIEVTVTYRCS